MLQPKKGKHRKMQKGRMRGKAYRGSTLSFGDYGLQALESHRITARQIEAARRALTRRGPPPASPKGGGGGPGRLALAPAPPPLLLLLGQ